MQNWPRIVEIVVVFGFTLTALYLSRVLRALTLTLEGMRGQLRKEAELKADNNRLRKVAGLPLE